MSDIFWLIVFASGWGLTGFLLALEWFERHPPRKVRRLVIAARVVAFDHGFDDHARDRGGEAYAALRELDAASEAFAEAVEWEGVE